MKNEKGFFYFHFYWVTNRCFFRAILVDENVRNQDVDQKLKLCVLNR